MSLDGTNDATYGAEDVTVVTRDGRPVTVVHLP